MSELPVSAADPGRLLAVLQMAADTYATLRSGPTVKVRAFILFVPATKYAWRLVESEEYVEASRKGLPIRRRMHFFDSVGKLRLCLHERIALSKALRIRAIDHLSVGQQVDEYQQLRHRFCKTNPDAVQFLPFYETPGPYDKRQS